ncbi:hypothetical protein AALA83_09500 [Oscillospiraceae bacterium 44-5]
MDKSHVKAQATHEANLAARTAWYEEQTAARRVARLALQRVTEDPEAAQEQLLEAARLLAELAH